MSSSPAGFAPDDPSDDRKKGQWQTRYPDPAAQKQILLETVYLSALLALVMALTFVCWAEWPNRLFRFEPRRYSTFLHFAVSWLAGTLGGVLFAMKWLYHTVAREYWNIDRRYWRYLTPHISGGLAFGATALIASGILRIFDPSALHSLASVAGVSFLVGYFSDNAVAKLSEIASTLFGRTEKADHRLPHGYQRTRMSSDADHDSQASPPA